MSDFLSKKKIQHLGTDCQAGQKLKNRAHVSASTVEICLHRSTQYRNVICMTS